MEQRGLVLTPEQQKTIDLAIKEHKVMKLIKAEIERYSKKKGRRI